MQEKIRPGYKQTEIGVIPEDWVCAPLNSLGEILTGGTPPTGNRALWGSGYPWVTPSDIKGCRDIFETERSITAAGIGHLRALPENTVLVTCIASIGKNAILRRAGSCNQQINAIVPRSSYSAEFIYYLMEHSVDRLKANAGITATAIISKKTFGSLLFAVPNFIEQSAIAAALSDSDARIAALDALIAKKRDLKQAAMQQLLTGKTRLPGFSGDWEVKRLGELVTLHKGQVIPSATPEDMFCHFSLPAFDAGGGPVFELGAEIGSNKFSVPSGALLVSKLNPRITRVWPVGVAPKQSVASTEFLVLLPKGEISSAFLNVLCISPLFCAKMENAVTGTTGSHQRVSPSDAMKLEVDLPLDRREQDAIAEILSDMDAELAALDAEADKARTIKQGMMQNLLTGTVRLV